MNSRAIRRHHRERLKNNRHFHWGRDLREEPKYLGKVVNTPTGCSCPMCGNERHNEWAKGCRETIQERRWKQKEKP